MIVEDGILKGDCLQLGTGIVYEEPRAGAVDSSPSSISETTVGSSSEPELESSPSLLSSLKLGFIIYFLRLSLK